MTEELKWLTLSNPDVVASPGLLVDADRVAENIRQMISVVGGTEKVARLRPHVKTHKMPDVVRMQMDAGIHKFKAATLSEAEMVARVGPSDVLLAYQPVGPNVERLAKLVSEFPESSFAAITDDADAVESIARRMTDRARPLRLFIDVDCGMHRTGIELGPSLDRLRERIESTDNVCFAGLHVYDGHIHDPSLSTRQSLAGTIVSQVRDYAKTNPPPLIIGGGSPTFAVWAEQTDWECSPGTPVFWDVGYGNAHPELPFLPAVALITRVISKPANRACLDLGYKSVSSEMPLEQRCCLPEIPDAKFVGQSEEHLVIESATTGNMRIGDAFLAYPKHVCPTVALHAYATIIRGGTATGETWPVAARDR